MNAAVFLYKLEKGIKNKINSISKIRSNAKKAGIIYYSYEQIQWLI